MWRFRQSDAEKMRTVIILIILVEGIQCDEIFPTEELLNDKSFFEQFVYLVELQDRQWHERGGDSPLKNLTDLLSDCAPIQGTNVNHTDYIRPNDIGFYAEIGSLSHYCKHNVTELSQGILDPCEHSLSSLNLPSVDKFIKKFNPNLTVIKPPKEGSLNEQGEEIIRRIQEYDDSNERWKLILVMPNILGGVAPTDKELSNEALAVISLLRLLNSNSTMERTMVVMIRNSDRGIWARASLANDACKRILNRYETKREQNFLSGVWKQVERIAKNHFRRDLFSVQTLAFLEDSDLIDPDSSEERVDLSLMGYDCSHFSAIGLSLFHIAIWNSLFTLESDRSEVLYRPQITHPRCADPQCPFIRTENNSNLCIWTPQKVEHDDRRIEQWIALGTLITAVILSAILIIILCCGSGRERIVKVEPEELKPVGADWSCITKFIDEDSYSAIIP